MKNINIFSFAGKMLTVFFVFCALFSISNTVFAQVATTTDFIYLSDVSGGLNSPCVDICIFPFQGAVSNPIDLTKTAYYFQALDGASELATPDISSINTSATTSSPVIVTYTATDTSTSSATLISSVTRQIYVVDPVQQLIDASNTIVNSINSQLDGINNLSNTAPKFNLISEIPGNGTTTITWSYTDPRNYISTSTGLVTRPAYSLSSTTTLTLLTANIDYYGATSIVNIPIFLANAAPSNDTNIVSINSTIFVSTTTSIISIPNQPIPVDAFLNSLEFYGTSTMSCPKAQPSSNYSCVNLNTVSTSTVAKGDTLDVFAQDGTKKTYTIILDDNTEIISFTIPVTKINGSTSTSAEALITKNPTGTSSSVLLVLPNDTATSTLGKIIPNIVTLDSRDNISSSVNNPLVYIITAVDGTTEDYYVTVVIDTTAPVITVNPQTVNLNVGDSFDVNSGVSVTDNYDTTVIVIHPGSFDTNTAGTYTITYTATDKAGNTATATRTINVNAIRHNGGHAPIITTTGSGSGTTTTVTTISVTPAKIATSTNKIFAKVTNNIAKKNIEKTLVINTASSTVAISNATSSAISSDASNTLTANVLGATPYNPTSTSNIIIDVIGIAVIAGIIVKSFGLIK